MEPGAKPVNMMQWKSGRLENLPVGVIAERPVSLTVNGETWLTFLCTPADLEALAVGFLFNENVIQSANELASVRVCPADDNVDVWLSHSVERPVAWRRTSGCTGGVTSEVRTELPALVDLGEVKLTPEKVIDLAHQLFASQELYRKVRGVHTSALSDGQTVLVVAEDIGRHNTLDKIAGKCLLERINPVERVLLTTGRISSEMIQKGSRLKACTVISRTSPSTLSIEIAEALGITLIGYVRRDRFNIYAHPERIQK